MTNKRNPEFIVPTNWKKISLSGDINLYIKEIKKGIPRTNKKGERLNTDGNPVQKGERCEMIDHETIYSLQFVNIKTDTELNIDELTVCNNVSVDEKTKTLQIDTKYGLKEARIKY